MEKSQYNKQLQFDESGNFKRIGDYLIGAQGGFPFSLHADGIGTLELGKISDKNSIRELTWTDTKNKIRITVRLEYDAETNIISRKDTIQNLSPKKQMIRKYLARFPFTCGEYEIYSQSSLWGRESIGKWNSLHAGKLELFSREGRWCEGSIPFAVLRDIYSTHALAFSVCPEGDWILRFSACNDGGGKLPYMTVEAGLSDDKLELELAPGECWTAPELLIQILPDRSATNGSAAMNRYLNRRFPPRAGHFPILYNTWLDRMSQLDVSRLERQLKAAKNCGCEIFVIDYGWYEDKRTFTRLDNWAECTDRAFFGDMKKFADKVRKAGLGFGFWVEMEFFSTQSEVVKKHPAWFFASAHPNIVCPKTWLPEVEDYLVKSLADTIQKYKAVYIKNDMNHSQGYEPSRLNRYQKGMYRVMARLRNLLPEVTFENCSSGSLRMAPGGMMESFDTHFISDNACPLENLRMYQGMLQRFAPGRIIHWYVGSELHSETDPKPSFAQSMIFQPKFATWYRFQSEDLDFGLLCNFMGPVGFSCDLASFSPENQKKIAKYVAFYKKYRECFIRAEGHLLTPVEDFDKQRGWAAIQLSDPEKDIHFMYVFHFLADGDAQRVFHPAALNSKVKYEVLTVFPEEKTEKRKNTGSELMENGIVFDLGENQHYGFRGQMLLLRPLVSRK